MRCCYNAYVHQRSDQNSQHCEYNTTNLLETPLSFSNASEHRYAEASKHIVSVENAGQGLEGIGYHIIPSDIWSPEKSLTCPWTSWLLLHRCNRNECERFTKFEWSCDQSHVKRLQIKGKLNSKEFCQSSNVVLKCPRKTPWTIN